MGITTALKHGDSPTLSLTALPNCLITTPESLDSLICRRSQALETVQTVILDEIHLLDNTYRGRPTAATALEIAEVGLRREFLGSSTLCDPFRA